MVGQLPRLFFSRPARCSRVLGPDDSRIALQRPLHRKLRRLRYLRRRSDCYRLERPVAGRVWLPL